LQKALDKAIAAEEILQEKCNKSKELLSTREKEKRQSITMAPPPALPIRPASVDKLPITRAQQLVTDVVTPKLRHSPRHSTPVTDATTVSSNTGSNKTQDFEFKLLSHHTSGRAKPST